MCILKLIFFLKVIILGWNLKISFSSQFLIYKPWQIVCVITVIILPWRSVLNLNISELKPPPHRLTSTSVTDAPGIPVVTAPSPLWLDVVPGGRRQAPSSVFDSLCLSGCRKTENGACRGMQILPPPKQRKRRFPLAECEGFFSFSLSQQLSMGPFLPTNSGQHRHVLHTHSGIKTNTSAYGFHIQTETSCIQKCIE